MEEILEGEKYKIEGTEREVEVLAVRKGFVMYRDKYQFPLVLKKEALIKGLKTGIL